MDRVWHVSEYRNTSSPDKTVASGDSDSDFYGNEEMVAELQDRVENFKTAHAYRQPLQSIPKEKKRQQLSAKASKLHNPYANVPYAWQLTETLPSFLKRLPPETTLATTSCPWIFICNPYIPRQSKVLAQNQDSKGNEDEAPEEEGTQLQVFIEGGTERLHLLTDFAGGSKRSGMASSFITRDINKQTKQAVKDILMLANVCRVRAGKWMLFCEPREVNEIWEIVAKATANNDLGIAAKVAPRSVDMGQRDRLICVYTSDFQDRNDVVRVLRKLRDLRVLDNMGRGIYYKPDAYTYLGIASGNPWEIKPSLYSSFEILRSS